MRSREGGKGCSVPCTRIRIARPEAPFRRLIRGATRYSEGLQKRSQPLGGVLLDGGPELVGSESLKAGSGLQDDRDVGRGGITWR
jgi:hypothetical protein